MGVYSFREKNFKTLHSLYFFFYNLIWGWFWTSFLVIPSTVELILLFLPSIPCLVRWCGKSGCRFKVSFPWDDACLPIMGQFLHWISSPTPYNPSHIPWFAQWDPAQGRPKEDNASSGFSPPWGRDTLTHPQWYLTGLFSFGSDAPKTWSYRRQRIG